ncbi:ADP-ribose pyrophosphatase YjhB (NUDIX family) [Propionibacteriaceae bacterium ES.041]|uniref:ADP-ribose pyrophosphatase n=1 Tax=Enemella evansiae TaxID=2016499 RepID=A0A255GP81_9ACTN|nr:NUDIX domain-containing protein [Enemella evansiae]PFG68966.1 ADP-ribose pyrophosphatase YjhB (NUDIX family) [Propionibacteriaceae bacterium ES.041]OYN96925.1 ADP-ribose pyrophosphatase [Enemella evansiae]OYO11921.1 ADP-ribose pyrophosphatase [Enemella evansiae]OYO17106.1 ADP-ribose pyrophosphatase [Enemella evansiae]OYO17628.1 ADP-ribose pyrophosphatase [Enemella evansiae]
MPTPDFILRLREKIGTELLWLPGVTAVVIDRSTPQPRVLCVRRADNGQWTPVTGIVDPGEPPAVAAEREVLEEAGITAVCEWLVSVEVVGPVTYDNGDRSQFVDHCFALRYLAGEPHPADGENTEAGWFPPDALPPMNERFQRAVQQALAEPGPARFTR